MDAALTHPQFITDDKGNKTAVILPINIYTELLEDLFDLAAAAERGSEPKWLSRESFLRSGLERRPSPRWRQKADELVAKTGLTVIEAEIEMQDTDRLHVIAWSGGLKNLVLRHRQVFDPSDAFSALAVNDGIACPGIKEGSASSASLRSDDRYLVLQDTHRPLLPGYTGHFEIVLHPPILALPNGVVKRAAPYKRRIRLTLSWLRIYKSLDAVAWERSGTVMTKTGMRMARSSRAREH